MSNEEKLLEYLSRGHYLPSFNLPIDAVPFIARTSVGGEEKITARMSDGLEKALRGYAPGSELTYKKMDFVVGGIFIEYMPRREIPEETGELEKARIKTDEVINRTKYWFENPKNVKFFHMCKVCKHTLKFDETLPSQVGELNEPCKVCGAEEQWLSLPTIRPPGFGPLIRATKREGFADVADMSYTSENNRMFTRTKWPTSLIEADGGEPLTHVLKEDKEGKIELLYHDGISILDINAGFGDHESDNTMGYAFCKDCGHMTPREQLPSNEGKHLRPYAIVREDGMFSGAYAQGGEIEDSFKEAMRTGCASPATQRQYEGYNRLLLGRLFTTNVMSLKIDWHENWLDLNSDEGREIGNRGAMTVCQALLQAICNADTKFAISPNDLGGDIRQMESEEGGFEIFIYERVDGGAGLLKQVYDNITDQWGGTHHRGSIFEEMKKILAGEKCLETTNEFSDNKFRTVARPCDSICQGCLQDFTTQHMQGELHRESGHQFFELALGGKSMPFNHHNTVLNLKYLVNEVYETAKLEDPDRELPEQEDIFENDHHRYIVIEGEDLPEEDEGARVSPLKGVKIGDAELVICPEIIDGRTQTMFHQTQVFENPIAVMARIEELISTEDDDDDDFEM